MLLLLVLAIFIVLIVFSMPIVFALGVAGVAGLFLGGYDMQVLSSSVVSGSQSWVLLAIPAFVFAGGLMEKCGMSHALVDFARALVGWVKGGLGMSVIVVAYFFSGVFTATEAGAVVAGYAFFAACFYYKNVSFLEMAKLAYDSAVLSAAVIFLLAVASVFQYLMGVS